MRLRNSSTIAFLILIGVSTAAADTRVLEEVIVTANKQAESLQEVAVTVNAFSSADILEAGLYDATDLAVMTPALNINVNTSPFNARFTLRGVGTAQTDPALEPSVGLFVDGIYIARTGLGMSDLTDIERIEVLQGPQGTLYGKNTNAGAISVVTKLPNLDSSEGFFEASAGNYGMGRVTASASGPVSDNVAYRLSGSLHQRDGYFENDVGDDLNDSDDWNIQGKLLWDTFDRLSVVLSASHIERETSCCGADVIQGDAVNDGLVARGLSADQNDPYDYDIAPGIESEFDMESDLVSLTLDYDLGWADLTSITAWNDYEYNVAFDVDRSQLDVMSLVDDEFAGDSFSQELRLAASIGDSVDYQLGVFYYEQTTERGGTGEPFFYLGEDFIEIASQQDLGFDFPIGFIAQPGDNLLGHFIQDTETLAFFGQATWHLSESWRLTGGLRWTDEEKESDLFSQTNSTAPSDALLGTSFLDSVSTPIDATLKRSVDNTDWLLRVAYTPSTDIMLFASAATGTKSGGFNSVNGTAEDREFDDEETLTYELGLKSTLFESRLRLNATAFYSVIDEFQAQQQLESGLGSFVSNDSEVETSGLDLQFEAVPLPNLTLSGGLLYMHKYEVTDGPNEGLELPFTAELSANLAATWVFPLKEGVVYWRTDYSYMDDHSTNVAAAENLRDSDFDDRNLLNMRLGWRNDSWDLSLWGKNLTDDEYATQTVEPLAVSGMDAFFLAEPLTYGATLRYQM